jgi:hypothetical protein
MIYSITGLVRWVDYIPVKFVGTATDNYAEAGGLSAINQSTGSNWTDFIKCYEDTSATKAWKCEADGYIPLYQYDGFYSFYAPLVSSLVLSKGTGTPTFTRADATPCATHVDFEGIVRVVPANAARFQGCRVVRNLLTFTEALTNAAWSKLISGTGVSPTVTDNFGVAPDGTTTASRIQATITAGTTASDYVIFRQNPAMGGTGVTAMWARATSGTAVVRMFDLGNQTLDTTWRRYSGNLQVDSRLIQLQGNLATDKTVDVLVWHPQAEQVVGQTNQNPSEYVPVGVLSYPYSGSGVDGLLFSPNLNGNTVSSNVVTAGTGAAIKQGTAGVSATAPVDASGPQGYLSEGARANIFLNSDLIGTSLATQSITVTAAPWTVSFTGTGTITFSGAFTGSLVGSGASTRVQQTFTPSAGSLTCTVTGTVQKAQAELGSFASSFIPTVASAVTRAVDVLTYPATGNYSDVPGTIYVEAVSGGVNSANTVLIGTTTARLIMQNLSTVNLSAVDGTNFSGAATGQTLGTMGKLAHAWTAASHGNMAVNGTVTALTGTFVGSYPVGAPATIYVSGYGAGSTWYGTQRNVRIWPTALTSAQLQAITA